MVAVTNNGYALSWGNPSNGKLGYEVNEKTDNQAKKFHYQTR